jgi:hypothetical protein
MLEIVVAITRVRRDERKLPKYPSLIQITTQWWVAIAYSLSSMETEHNAFAYYMKSYTNRISSVKGF